MWAVQCVRPRRTVTYFILIIAIVGYEKCIYFEICVMVVDSYTCVCVC